MSDAFYRYEPYFFNYNRDLSSNMPRAHFHKNFEIYYLISGRRRYTIEDKFYGLAPGDMILIPEMTTHKVWNAPGTVPGEYHERFLLTPQRKHIPDVFLPCFDTHFYHLPKDAQETIVECFESLQDAQKDDVFADYYNQANLLKILCTLARIPSANKRTAPLSKTDLIVQDAAAYIKAHYSEQISLGELAAKYSFSKEYFSTLFKTTIGFGFNEYLNHTRIAEASVLLASTTLSVSQISLQCGFNDSNYFSDVFKRIIGLTPRDFRANHK